MEALLLVRPRVDRTAWMNRTKEYTTRNNMLSRQEFRLGDFTGLLPSNRYSD